MPSGSLQYLLQALQPVPDQPDLVLRSLDALGGLLLEGVYHPHISAELQCVENPERICPVRYRETPESPFRPRLSRQSAWLVSSWAARPNVVISDNNLQGIVSHRHGSPFGLCPTCDSIPISWDFIRKKAIDTEKPLSNVRTPMHIEAKKSCTSRPLSAGLSPCAPLYGPCRQPTDNTLLFSV